MIGTLWQGYSDSNGEMRDQNPVFYQLDYTPTDQLNIYSNPNLYDISNLYTMVYSCDAIYGNKIDGHTKDRNTDNINFDIDTFFCSYYRFALYNYG